MDRPQRQLFNEGITTYIFARHRLPLRAIFILMNTSNFRSCFFAMVLASSLFLRAEDAPIIRPDQTAPVPHPNLPTDDWTLKGVGGKSPLYVNGQLPRPAGQMVNMHGSVRGLVLVQQGRYLIAKSNSTVAVVDAASFKVLKQYEIPNKDGGAMFGIAASADGSAVYLSAENSKLLTAKIDAAGGLTFGAAIDLKTGKGPIYPLGVALAKQDSVALVALSITNQLGVIDLANQKVTARIDVGVCPYGVILGADGNTVFVSNFGGPRARPGDKTEKAAGTDVAVDARSIALRGSVSVIDLAALKVVAEIETPIHPESMVLAPDGKTLYVVDASGDGISVIDVAQRKVIKQLNTKPRMDLPYGSLTDGLAISADGATLYAANAGNNAIALIDPSSPANVPFALIPSSVFPGSVCVSGNVLFSGSVEGFGGDLQRVAIPAGKEELKTLTAAAENGFHFPEIVRAMTRARAGVPPVAVPVNPGEPSLIKHLVYIIKENKKFDQLLGDMGKGNCDPKLCEFGRAITPNAHALADQFVLLDNYYCCSGNSAKGHQWEMQGLVTPYRLKGEAPRVAYDFGTDALTYAGCGFIWDHALRQGVSFRNFGEMEVATMTKGKTWTDSYNTWKAQAGPIEFEQDCEVEVLRNYSDKRFPGWEMSIPDQYRADVFLTALKEYETAGKQPELILIYLPSDHTRSNKASPTPRAYVADNDLAMGRCIEALSKSPFWKDMLIIANEDDPQTGADHVSGFRSVCYIASPYAKRKELVSRFYNQSSVLHTFCNIMGIPPMNQMVASAPLMSDCFQNTPDFTPFTCLPETVALNEMTLPPKPGGKQGALLERTQNLNFSAPDRLKKNEQELFSRYSWSTVNGDAPFPIEYWGPHGKGLKPLGLSLESIGAEQDDDD